MNTAVASLPSEREVLVKRSFDAPAHLVWRAYVEPGLMRRWCTGPDGWVMSVCEMDVRVGGQYAWQWRNDSMGQEFGCHGVFQEVEDGRKIVHTQAWGNVGDTMGSEPFVVTVELSEIEGKTTVDTLMTFASMEDRDAAFATGMTDGMEMGYKRLEELAGSL